MYSEASILTSIPSWCCPPPPRLLLVEQAPELLELVVEVPAGDHPVVVPSVAEEGIVKGAPHAERREGVDVEGHLFFLGFWFGLVVLSEILVFELPVFSSVPNLYKTATFPDLSRTIWPHLEGRLVLPRDSSSLIG